MAELAAFFSNTQGPVFFSGNTIVNATGNVQLSRNVPEDRLSALNHELLSHVARQAMHNAASDREKGTNAIPRCADKTRIKVQGDIMRWVCSGAETRNKILFLSGAAGAGKTAIASSIADRCHSENTLAATFFFSSVRSRETRSTRYLIPTLAYQIYQIRGLEVPAGRALDNIRREPTIFDDSLAYQLQALILKPLRDSWSQPNEPGAARILCSSQVILIDGIDEIGGDASQSVENIKEQNEVLSALLKAAEDIYFPFRILIASRPEPNIKNTLSKAGSNAVRPLFLDDNYNPEDDIKVYLHSEFSRIHDIHYPGGQGGRSWPGDEVVNVLAKNSSGQFVYPAAIVRYVERRHEGSPRSPEARLELVLSWKPSPARNDRGREPFKFLDQLYAGIIKRCLSGSVVDKVKWLRAIGRSPGLPAWFWRKFLAEDEHEAKVALQGLDSLVHIPGNKTELPYVFYHKTLVDFLEDGARSRELGLPLDFGKVFSQFLQNRFIGALKKYGPAHTSTPDFEALEVQSFTDYFLSAIESLHPAFDDPHLCAKDDFTSCDMGYWSQQIILRVAERRSEPSVVCQWFQFIHTPCPWYRCRRACKHWRRPILATCESQGWITPGTVVLLLNRFMRKTKVDGVVHGYPPEEHFHPKLHPVAEPHEAGQPL